MHPTGLSCINTIFFFCFLIICAAVLATSGSQVKKTQCKEYGFCSTTLNIEDTTVENLQALQADGVVTSLDLVETHIQRIKQVNERFRAVSEINPDAAAIARRLDEERRHGKTRGPLHGIPILVKDNVATRDRMNNTAGSFALLGATVAQESTIVRKLRDAGAVILGKATTGVWAQYRSSIPSSSHGWSPYGGQTVGAYYPQQDPSGSSSGSAVATTLGLTLGAVATETYGSILLPAEKSNIVGIKPTVGLTSRHMVIPISRRQDTVGPHARTVKDAAVLLSIMAGIDKRDNWTLVQPFEEVPDYIKSCNLAALMGAKIGVPRNGFSDLLSVSTEPIMAAFEGALDLMRQAGADVRDGANFASFDLKAVLGNTTTVLDADFAPDIEKYFSKLVKNPSSIHNLQDLLAFTKGSISEGWPDRDSSVWERILDRNITNDSVETHIAYQANLRMAQEDGVLGSLDKYGLDALVMPTFASFHLPAIAGLPVITVPLGFFSSDAKVTLNAKGTLVNTAPGIPFGISFIGRRWSEETLIGLAYAFEQRTKVRKQRSAMFRPTIELRDQTRLLHPSRVEIPTVPSPEEMGFDQAGTLSKDADVFDGLQRGWLDSMAEIAAQT